MMKKFLCCLFLLAGLNSQAQFFTGYNMIQLGRWDNDSLPAIGTQQFSNGWGWVDSASGREYAIMGSIDSTYFIEVTNPSAPVVRDVRAGRVNRSVWREYKTYKNYCYGVADHGFSSLQIFDMSYLPDSVHLVYDSDTLFTRSHSIYIDKDRLYCNSVTTKNGQRHAVTVYSLANPEDPTLLGEIVPPVFDGIPAFVVCHDAFVRNDTLYCSGENAGVFIYDMADAQNPQLLATIGEYPERGYNHSGFLSDDGQVFVFTDENLGLGIKAFDVSDLGNIEQLSLFRSHDGAVAHNPYFIGRRLFMSYYHDGLYVYNMNDPKNPEVIAWYDTYPQNGTSYAGFEGCWGTYPFLPSGNLLAFDMTNGLFVLRMDATAASNPEGIETKDFFLYPNPGNGSFNLEWDNAGDETLTLRVVNASGEIILERTLPTETGRNRATLELTGAASGMYLVQLTGTKSHICRKLLLR